MKLFALAFSAVGIVALALPLLVVSVVATHPWLALGMLAGNVQVVDQRPVRTAYATPMPSIGSGSSGVPFMPTELIAETMKWVNARVPYLWGGCTTHGVDCSCFVRNVLAVFGINAPRTTVQQIAWATPVRRDQLAVGDIVFFDNTCSDCGPNPTHEGLYIGGGLMVNAGDPVQVAPVL